MLVDMWKIHLDPRVWLDPLVFKTERFLSTHKDVDLSQHLELIPFGSGRRICPGISFALHSMQFILASLLQQGYTKLMKLIKTSIILIKDHLQIHEKSLSYPALL